MEYGIRGIPKVRQAGARTYFEELEARVKDNPRLETWEVNSILNITGAPIPPWPGISGATGRASS